MSFVWMVTTTPAGGDCSMPFTEEEVAYLRSQPLARVEPVGDTWYEPNRTVHQIRT
jgi:hypothetical protein